jgi:transposase
VLPRCCLPSGHKLNRTPRTTSRVVPRRQRPVCCTQEPNDRFRPALDTVRLETEVSMTTILGLDPHPGSHTVVALNAHGAILDSLQVSNDSAGIQRLLEWRNTFTERRWAIAGANKRFIRGFVATLLEQGEVVVNIPPTLTSQYRARRGKKKNDVIDAENAARVLLANPELPKVQVSADHQALQECTRVQQCLSTELKAHRVSARAMQDNSSLKAVLEAVIAVLVAQLKVLERQIRSLVEVVMPELLELRGVGVIVAGTLLAEAGDFTRFASQHAFAAYCGVAPVERGSGQNTRVQVNTGGNRRLNWALHIIVLNRLRSDGGHSQALLAKKKGEGKSFRAGLRVLKTYIAREVFRTATRAPCAKQKPVDRVVESAVRA